MGYYFECPYCNRRIPVYPPYDLDNLVERSCEGCSEEMCEECCVGGLCPDCWDEEVEDEND